MSDISTSLPVPTARDLRPQEHIHRGSGGDPLKFLPDAAADRLRQLQLRVNDTRGLLPSFEARHAASSERLLAQTELDRLVAYTGFRLPETDARVRGGKQRVAELTAEQERLNALHATRSAAFQAASDVLSNVTAWLRDGRPGNTIIEHHEASEPTLKAGETMNAAIQRHRAKCKELQGALDVIRASKFPASYAKMRMREMVEKIAQRGAVDVGPLINADIELTLPTQRMTAQVLGGGAESGGLAFSQIPDIAMVVWLHRDQLIQRLDREIDAAANDASALTHEQRQEREATVLAELLSAERDEAALIWRAQHDGVQIEHRADCSPCAILGCKLVTAPRAAPPEASSPGMSWPVVETGRRRQ